MESQSGRRILSFVTNAGTRHDVINAYVGTLWHVSNSPCVCNYAPEIGKVELLFN